MDSGILLYPAKFDNQIRVFEIASQAGIFLLKVVDPVGHEDVGQGA